MKTQRLTNDLKDKIVDAASRKAFGDRKQQITQRLQALAVRVYNMHYPAELQELMHALQDKTGGRAFEVSTSFCNQYFAGRRGTMQFPEAKLFLADRRDPKFEHLDAAHPLTLEFYAIYDVSEALKEETKQLRREVRGVLNSVTTVKKLLEVWPAVAELLPDPAKPEAALPAIQLDKINAAIFHTEG